MKRVAPLLVLVAACSRDEHRASEQTPMPSGMLVPAPSASAAAGGVVTFSYRTDAGVSRFVVPLDKMAMLNGALARAKPGHDPFVAEDLSPAENAKFDEGLAAINAARSADAPGLVEMVRALRALLTEARLRGETVTVSAPTG